MISAASTRKTIIHRLQKQLINVLLMNTQNLDLLLQEQTCILKGTTQKRVLTNFESWAGLF